MVASCRSQAPCRAHGGSMHALAVRAATATDARGNRPSILRAARALVIALPTPFHRKPLTHRLACMHTAKHFDAAPTRCHESRRARGT
eukprot:351140-Chlamydomonas_euryale.AAC.35